ncbi:MAG: hypothetical protein H6566_06380 [Lewinellaceae bacterium]|nr:hypothetical protein [Lewinellaceae bacterium]
MRPLMFALSIVAGVALLFLVAKILVFGLMLLAPFALLAAIVFGIRRMAGYGYAPYRRAHWHGHHFRHWSSRMEAPLGHTPYRQAEPLEDYRTFVVE